MNIDARLNVFDRHRTIRKFKTRLLEPGHFEQLLWAAQRAPTDATAQMYSFLRLTDPELRSKMANLTRNPHIETASEALIVLADVNRLRQLLEHKGYVFGNWSAVAIHFAIGDAVLAGQNMLIAAEMLGYQGCWIGGVLSALEEIVALLDLPTGVIPFSGLVIGVPDEQPAQRPRIQAELVLHENRYHQPTAVELDTALEHMASISARGDWAHTLSRYFAAGGAMEQRETMMRRVLEQQGFGHVAQHADLNALMNRAMTAGFDEMLIRFKNDVFEAWVDRPNEAHRGQGSTPISAFEQAVLTAENGDAFRIS